jgi:SAM-dependent methyltransferase
LPSVNDTVETHAPARRQPELALGTLFRAALFHYGRFLGNGNRTLHEVTAALDAKPDERVLDVGCGTGSFCLAAPGDYLGIDLDPDYIAFARWRWGTPRRRFETIELAALDEPAGFDRAVLVNCLHHMSDAVADTVLAQLRRLVRRRLVVADANPEESNRFQALLLAFDRGNFIRPVAAQRALVERHFGVTAERRFANTPRTGLQVLLVCEPRS